HPVATLVDVRGPARRSAQRTRARTRDQRGVGRAGTHTREQAGVARTVHAQTEWVEVAVGAMGGATAGGPTSAGRPQWSRQSRSNRTATLLEESHRRPRRDIRRRRPARTLENDLRAR